MAYRPRIVETSSDAEPKNTKVRGVSLAPTLVASDVQMAGGKRTRKIEIRTGVTARAAGSASVSFGKTSVLCSVHGPRAIRRSTDFAERGTLTCSVRLLPFSIRSSSVGAGNTKRRHSAREAETLRMRRERELAAAVQRSIEGSVRLERFPKSLVELHLLISSDDGSTQSACVTAASLALADSGIELFDLVPCATVGVKSKSGSSSEKELIVDPDSALLETCESWMCLALTPASDSASDMCVEGALSFEIAGLATKACFEECARLHNLMRDHLLQMAAKREQDMLAQ